jgi:hypothetical protein
MLPPPTFGYLHDIQGRTLYSLHERLADWTFPQLCRLFVGNAENLEAIQRISAARPTPIEYGELFVDPHPALVLQIMKGLTYEQQHEYLRVCIERFEAEMDELQRLEAALTCLEHLNVGDPEEYLILDADQQGYVRRTYRAFRL